MQLRDDFSKHISELNNPLERPYSRDIDTSLLKNIDDINHLNKEVQNINPDYMTFLPAYFWVFYFAIGWVYFSVFFFIISLIDDINYFYLNDWSIINVFVTLFIFVPSCTPLILLLYQFIRKNPYRTQYYFLKK